MWIHGLTFKVVTWKDEFKYLSIYLEYKRSHFLSANVSSFNCVTCHFIFKVAFLLWFLSKEKEEMVEFRWLGSLHSGDATISSITAPYFFFPCIAFILLYICFINPIFIKTKLPLIPFSMSELLCSPIIVFSQHILVCGRIIHTCTEQKKNNA